MMHNSKSNSDDESDSEGDDSEDGRSRWKQNNDLEMECVFLDED